MVFAPLLRPSLTRLKKVCLASSGRLVKIMLERGGRGQAFLLTSWMLAFFFLPCLSSFSLPVAWEKTTKGQGLTLKPLRSLEDYRQLRLGQRLVLRCPRMGTTIYTTVRDVDGKGRLRLVETREGWRFSAGGCTILLMRHGAEKTVRSMMVCPDGTLAPIHCYQMKPLKG
jgi:hypothetical protein